MKMVKPVVLVAAAIPVILAILIVIPMVTMEEIPMSAINSYDKIQIEFTKHDLRIVSFGVTDKTSEKIVLNHSYNDLQIEWFKAGSAMNFLRKKQN